MALDSSGPDTAMDQDAARAKEDLPAELPPSGSGELGDLLRSAYQQAIEEPVPDDLLDLLNRLK